MENAIVVLMTLFTMTFIVNLINGNMIGRHDGVRANSNCMVRISRGASLLLFFSRRRIYNVWSFLGQCAAVLFLCFSMGAQAIRAEFIVNHYRPILISFVAIEATLYLCLFVDAMIYYGNR